MERALSDEEKLRKAEAIYNRRKMEGIRVSSSAVNTNTRRELKSAKRMLLQIAICIILYIIVYLVQNSNYIFSDDFITKAKEILSYDINVKEKVSQVIQQFGENEQIKTFFNGTKEEQKQVESNEINNIENENTEEQTNTVTEENTLSATDNSEYIEDTSSYNQMQLDANDIKNNYELNLPLKGTITSRFGFRDIEPKFHTGIDIAANTGSDIISAIDGEVILASTTGSYGNHLKINNGDITTLYAHCSKLCVKEGEKITKGQKIAEVGMTGNATGPHLHFEIIKNERFVNPEYVMEF